MQWIARQNIKFQVKNDRSEPFNLLFISNSCRKSNFIFFWNFFANFLGPKKVAWFENFGSSNSDDFLPTQKIVNNLKKYIKFCLLKEFDMENKLNGSNWSFLTWSLRFWYGAWLYPYNVLHFRLIYIYREFIYCASSSTSAETLPVQNLIFHARNFNLSSSIKILYYNLVEY
jgi:hypothetical protein